MNREIKFRQILDGIFHYWGFINGRFIGPADSSSGENPATTIHQQITGVKDKNEKDIYFGDIVNLIDFESAEGEEKINGAIVTETITGGTGILDQNKCAISEFWEDENVFSIEVIGNIFENPELLINK